jgi:hypothetical protein
VGLVDTNWALTIKPCDLKTHQAAQIAREERAKRDAQIVEAYKRCGTIHETRRVFDFTYSREVIRKAISKAGIYDKCQRDQRLIARAKAKTIKPSSNHEKVSKEYRSELEMQKQASRLLSENGIKHKSEVKVGGCGMRADFTGHNWAIETKKQCTSQGIMVGMAQCLVYRKHLNKRHVCILLPDDLEPASFYVSECLSYGIPIIKMSQLVWWVNAVQADAQPN